MATPIKDKSKMNYQSLEALAPVNKVISEAQLALNNSSYNIHNSNISEVLMGATGAGLGGAASFAALYYGGSVVGLSAAGITSGLAAAGSIVGGGMVAGVAVLAAPAVVLGGVGVSVAAAAKTQKLLDAKQTCYVEAVRKQDAIEKALKSEIHADKQRIEALQGLNTLLQVAVRDLKQDLGYG